MILKYLGKFNLSTNVQKKEHITTKQTENPQICEKNVLNLNMDFHSISAETYPELKFRTNITNSFLEAYYTYSFNLKGNKKTSLKKMNSILYDLLRKKMTENF